MFMYLATLIIFPNNIRTSLPQDYVNQMYLLCNACNYRYHITPVGPSKKFKIDGEVKLCFNKGHCDVNLLFKDMPLHYKICNASSGEVAFQGMIHRKQFLL